MEAGCAYVFMYFTLQVLLPCPLTLTLAEESQTLVAKLYQALRFIGLGFGIAELLRSLTVAAIPTQLTTRPHAPSDTHAACCELYSSISLSIGQFSGGFVTSTELFVLSLSPR